MTTKNATMAKVEILCGLPGSGKTTYGKRREDAIKEEALKVPHHKRTNAMFAAYVDMDKHMHQRGTKRKIEQVDVWLTKADIGHLLMARGTVILDGLFLTQKVYEDLVRELPDASAIEFHYWAPDRDSCRHNDRYRREQDSELTIREAPCDKPYLERLKAIYPNIPVTLKMHTVVRKDDFQLFKDKYRLERDYGVGRNTLRSYEWTLGGESRDSWGDTSSISPSPQPAEFDAFDELLTKVWPDIGFLHYKELKRETVRVQQESKSDYYSSYDIGYYECDLYRLYELLKEHGKLDLS